MNLPLGHGSKHDAVKAVCSREGPLLVCLLSCCLTPRVGALGAARLGRRLQRSLAGVRRVRLHVRLLIVVVRIGKNAVLLHCPSGHHFLTDADTPPRFSVARSVSKPVLSAKISDWDEIK